MEYPRMVLDLEDKLERDMQRGNISKASSLIYVNTGFATALLAGA